MTYLGKNKGTKMKKLIVVICAAAMAALSLMADCGVQVCATNGVQVCATDVFAPTVTTNLVIAYEIVESKMVRCACPDGYEGCLAAHYRRVSETRYERAAAKTETYVLTAPEMSEVIGWIARRDSNDVAAVSLPLDEQHPVGFIDLRVVRELLRNAKAQKECAYDILPSRP